MMTPKEVMSLCRQKDVKAVDLRFADLLGAWHQVTIPISKLDEELFDDGVAINASNVPLWKQDHESDLLAVPLAETAIVSPVVDSPSAEIICVLQEPVTKDDYTLDPRTICKRSADFLESTGIADTANFGPEAEFFLFDDVRFDQAGSSGYYFVNSSEGEWNRGIAMANSGPAVGHEQGYSQVPPKDQMTAIRHEMMQSMIDAGMEVERHHHEAASAGQMEIDLCFKPILQMADTVMRLKYIVKNVACKHQKTATFMPKPIFDDHGSGMHIHFSLWKNGDPLFAGSRESGLSDMGHYALGGILRHTPALLAFTNPTTNSYKRLVPGFQAPVLVTYSRSNRTAACRIPMFGPDPKSKRIEFRCPDGSSNPYLAFAAILMAAIDGIQNKLDPGEPQDGNCYELYSQPSVEIPKLPISLGHALVSLEKDHEFLMRDGVFSKELIESWIAHKRDLDVQNVRTRPHPYEFCMYYDC